MGEILVNTGNEHYLGVSPRIKLKAPSGFPANAFVFTVDTTNTESGSSNSDQYKIPLAGGSINATVDWGDGSTDLITSITDPALTHTYSSSGTYQIQIIGTISSFRVGNAAASDKLKLISIEQWGTGFSTSSLNGIFYGCSNLTEITATDAPTLSSINLSRFFRSCTSLTTINNIENWAFPSNVTNIDEFFQSCTSLTTQRTDIDTSGITSNVSCRTMYSGCTNYNGITIQVTSRFTNCQTMFSSCTAFNNSSVTTFDMSSVTNIFNMFRDCRAFNQDISGWDISSVVGSADYFVGASSGSMAFDQDLGGWDVSGITSMNNMFSQCPINQDLSQWDVSNVTSMIAMFRNCLNMNMNFGLWDISSVNVSPGNFLENNTGMTTANYDSTLIAWDALVVNSGLTWNFGNVQYTKAPSAAETARANLIASDLWTITDGGATP